MTETVKMRGSRARDDALDARMARIVERLAPLHTRLCPRQVLGARLGLYGGELLGLELPRLDKRLLTIVETDGCFVDGVIEATGCRVGRRTLRVVDHGKVAAVFVDVETGQSIRVWPHPNARQQACRYALGHTDAWHAQLDAYRWMPASELLEARDVALRIPLRTLLGRAGARVECTRCGEEIMNDRHVQVDGRVVCRSCVGDRYWTADAIQTVEAGNRAASCGSMLFSENTRSSSLPALA
jgi:formylmethanofuran dehydrogenase subunit E